MPVASCVLSVGPSEKSLADPFDSTHHTCPVVTNETSIQLKSLTFGVGEEERLLTTYLLPVAKGSVQRSLRLPTLTVVWIHHSPLCRGLHLRTTTLIQVSGCFII